MKDFLHRNKIKTAKYLNSSDFNEISKFISDNDINWDIKELTIDKDGAKILKGE